MNSQLIINILKDPDFEIQGTSYDSVETEFEIKPNEFLKFSEDDFSSNYVHKDVNALSNAKRALDSQLDTLLIIFGLYNKYLKFPKKILLIQELGIVAPRVLTKINKIRNLMEHEYIKPMSGEVEDFIDIVALFFSATDKFIYNLTYYISYNVIRNKDDRDNLKFIYEGSIEVTHEGISFENLNHESNENSNIIVNRNDGDYTQILKLYLEKTMKY